MIQNIQNTWQTVSSLFTQLWFRQSISLFVFLVMFVIFKKYQDRMKIRSEQSAQSTTMVPIQYNRKQAWVAIIGSMLFFCFLFWPKVELAVGWLALVVSFYVLLDTNVLGSVREASTHAQQAHQSSSSASTAAGEAHHAATEAGQLADKARLSVEEASRKVDNLKDATGQLADRVKQLLGIDPIQDLEKVVKRLQDTIKIAMSTQDDGADPRTESKTFFLASVPAVGLRGAPNEGERFIAELKAASRRLKHNLKVICYDSQGWKSFYQEERGLTDQAELDYLGDQNNQLVQFLKRYSGAKNIMEIPRDNLVRSMPLPNQTVEVIKALPFLDCLHFLIVNWSETAQVQPQAVLWHLDYMKRGGVKGAGFWTSNRQIIATFAEVFEQRAININGATA